MHTSEPPPATGLLRKITPAERQAYHQDGVVRLKAVISPCWIDFLRSAMSRLLNEPDPTSQNYTSTGKARFFSQVFPRLLEPAFDHWMRLGPTKEIAAQIHPGSGGFRAFFDQVFAMEPGAPNGAPYHQDYPYLPITGEQTFRIWVPLDPVTAEGGAVRYLKGSHLGPVYRPRSFSGRADVEAVYERSPYPTAPDFEAECDAAAWFVGAAAPGDALLHHPKTVHGSPPNTTHNFRRAVTTMFVGDDVRWDPREGTSFEHIGLPEDHAMPATPEGGRVRGALFPVVWPATALGAFS